MSVKTIYTCDRCGHSQESAGSDYVAQAEGGNRQLWWATLSMRAHGCRDQTAWQGVFCRQCVIEAGLKKLPSGEGFEPPPKPPTLEDYIRLIVREEIPG